jgi:hypothetical protein
MRKAGALQVAQRPGDAGKRMQLWPRRHRFGRKPAFREAHHASSAGLEDAARLTQHRFGAGEVFDRQGAHHDVECALGKRQARIGIQVVDEPFGQFCIRLQLHRIHAEANETGGLQRLGQMRVDARHQVEHAHHRCHETGGELAPDGLRAGIEVRDEARLGVEGGVVLMCAWIGLFQRSERREIGLTLHAVFQCGQQRHPARGRRVIAAQDARLQRAGGRGKRHLCRLASAEFHQLRREARRQVAFGGIDAGEMMPVAMRRELARPGQCQFEGAAQVLSRAR